MIFIGRLVRWEAMSGEVKGVIAFKNKSGNFWVEIFDREGKKTGKGIVISAGDISKSLINGGEYDI